MKTQTPSGNISTTVAKRKKNELDALTIQVMDAQGDVAKYQSIVIALTSKSNDLQGFLAMATNNKTQAYNNKILIDQLVQSAANLQQNSKIAAKEIAEANVKTKLFIEKFNKVMGKLIYSANLINKLANLIVRQHALNPLISDDLVSKITAAAADANNAVALNLVALQSAFAAQATEMEAESAVKLEYTQSIALTDMLTVPAETDDTSPLKTLFDQAYTAAEKNYTLTKKANSTATEQLGVANANLSKAQIKLNSLQSGLAAANAAALAS